MSEKRAPWNEKVWIDEQKQTDGPLRVGNEAYREGWERCFGKKEAGEISTVKLKLWDAPGWDGIRETYAAMEKP